MVQLSELKSSDIVACTQAGEAEGAQGNTDRHHPQSRRRVNAIETRVWVRCRLEGSVGGDKRRPRRPPAKKENRTWLLRCEPISSGIFHIPRIFERGKSSFPSSIMASGAGAGGSHEHSRNRGPPHPLHRITITAQQRVPRRIRSTVDHHSRTDSWGFELPESRNVEWAE